jgi:hypothetical protein
VRHRSSRGRRNIRHYSHRPGSRNRSRCCKRPQRYRRQQRLPLYQRQYPRLYQNLGPKREGVVAIHQIANKQDFLIGIATVDLLDPKKVRSFLKELFLNEGTAFDLTAIRFDIGQDAIGAA